MISVKVVGATGYGGIGITELLLQHPRVSISALVARDDVGKKICDVYPHLRGFCDLPILSADDPDAQRPADIVFFATPDGVAMTSAEAELNKGAKVIDYSGDFRFTSAERYADYATRLNKNPVHQSPHLLGKNVYGLAELHAPAIESASLVGNPGCFAASCILGLAPAAKANIMAPNSVICDCKSGVSGAGKKIAQTFHFPERQDNINAYRLSGHQHTCEIEQQLSALANAPITVTFTAHVLPICRGILSTLYATLNAPMTETDLLDLYAAFYKNAPFIRVLPSTSATGTLHVRGSNFCNLTVSVDSRTQRMRIVSHIDNLMKGQAANALQNMNLMCGFSETTALYRPGFYP
jgi:N-acetyl-gamma-glutamyl-phosphate reductase